MTDIKRVGVLGCGLMGAGIAEVCARAGSDVVVVEMDDAAAAAGQARIIKSLDKAVAAGKLGEGERDAAVARICFGTEFHVFADRQLVIEAVPEIPGLKLVEMVPSLCTSADSLERTRDYASEVLGKKVIAAPDRAGFVVTALLVPYMLSATRMLEAGFATAEDIDTAMVEGCAHPMGPVRLTDLVGPDTTLHVAVSLYEEFKEPHLAPPALPMRMVESDLLGHKSGHGFYSYS